MGKRLGSTVRGAREARGLSLRAGARLAGVSLNMLWRIEHDQTHPPEPEVFTKLQALGTPKRELMLDAALDNLEEWAPAFGVPLDTLVELLHQRLTESQA